MRYFETLLSLSCEERFPLWETSLRSVLQMINLMFVYFVYFVIEFCVFVIEFCVFCEWLWMWLWLCISLSVKKFLRMLTDNTSGSFSSDIKSTSDKAFLLWKIVWLSFSFCDCICNSIAVWSVFTHSSHLTLDSAKNRVVVCKFVWI